MPRSLFNYDDGTFRLCSQKSKLLDILKSLPSTNNDLVQNQTTLHTACPDYQEIRFSAAIVDGMAELHALQKCNDIKTCQDLVEAFTMKIEIKYWKYDELHLVFDTYKDQSKKNITRQKRVQEPLHAIKSQIIRILIIFQCKSYVQVSIRRMN